MKSKPELRKRTSLWLLIAALVTFVLVTLALRPNPLEALAGQTNQTKEITMKQQPTTLEPMTSEAMKSLARRWTEELWSKGDLSVADEIVSPDYVRHDPGDPAAFDGIEGVKQLVTLVRTSMPDLQLTIQDMIAEGDRVVSRYAGSGTDLGGYMGQPPTGKRITMSAIQVFRIQDGKIVESWAQRDDVGILRQLGIISTPAKKQEQAQ
jgi:steroid delta-isomerase-like uncharacterized protein